MNLIVESLHVGYDKIAVLWDVSFQIPKGVIGAILGPNGAGKSTLLKAIVGLIEPFSGRIDLLGSKIAYVPQRESIDWDFPITAEEVVLMGRYGKLGLFGRIRKADREAALNALNLVGMLPFAKRQISQLSGGQQQRLFIARALVQNAEILLLDEPFAGVDMATEKAIIELLKEQQSLGKTILVVHHDLSTVVDYFDWTLLLNTRLIGCGPTNVVYQPDNLRKTFGKGQMLFDEAADSLAKKKERPLMIEFFTDPVLRGPTWGTLFMCIASSLMGAALFLKRRSLLAESLSHSAYPGAVIGVSVFAFFFPASQEGSFFALIGGAFATSFLGLLAINWMEKKGGVRSDAALCFILALFFGVGTVFASAMQYVIPSWRSSLQTLMFGQAATMSDFHIYLYASLTSVVLLFITLMFRPLSLVLFDSDFAKSSKVQVKWVERAIFWLFLFSLILGIRSVGIVLMSGMAIAPAIAARQFTDRLQWFFFLSALFGALSGLIGNILSVIAAESLELALPTGPAIILTASAIAFLSLLFAPKRGWVFRVRRMAAFRFQCLKENLLKTMWKKGAALTSQELRKIHPASALSMAALLRSLQKGGWILQGGGRYHLTVDGRRKAASIVRLHRLWELYLSSELGVKDEKIHLNAEEMEHILTPEIEERLTKLLSNPKLDPHAQPIPERSLL